MEETKKNVQGIDEEELNAAQAEAEGENTDGKKADVDSGKRIVILKRPIEYMGTKYKELHFDYDKLTGKDSLEVEDEIEKTTHLTVVAPALNLEYLIRISARACDEPIGRDDIVNMNLSDFNHVRNIARNFMLRSDR